MNVQQVKEKAEEIYGIMVDARRHLHKYPELGQKEYETQRFILDFLEAEDIPCYKTADTGVVALIEGNGKGNVVALRSDMDALPLEEDSTAPCRSVYKGVMHACGHDAHMAINLGCAKFFHDNRQMLDGAVKLFFQPAEETVGGAKRMITDGCMENPHVDYVVGLHMTPYLNYDQVEVKYGAINASTNSVTMVVKGRGGHGAYPSECVDAIVITAQILVALQSVVSRDISPLDSAVFTVGKICGGKAGNIIADEVIIEGTVRASSIEVEKIMYQRINSIATSIAESMGGACIVHFSENGYLPLVNDKSVMDVIKSCASSYLGEGHVLLKEKMSMGGDDFSFFNEHIPGAYYNLGCKVPGTESYSLHTNRFDIDERCLKTGLVLQVLSAIALTRHP